MFHEMQFIEKYEELGWELLAFPHWLIFLLIPEGVGLWFSMLISGLDLWDCTNQLWYLTESLCRHCLLGASSLWSILDLISLAMLLFFGGIPQVLLLGHFFSILLSSWDQLLLELLLWIVPLMSLLWVQDPYLHLLRVNHSHYGFVLERPLDSILGALVFDSTFHLPPRHFPL